VTDYREMWEQLKKMEKEARKVGEAVIGVITVRPPPEEPKITILRKWSYKYDKDKH